jgi:OFA family oxalate/formate antiporter-like MFS transporter
LKPIGNIRGLGSVLPRPWIVVTASFFLTSTFGIIYSYSDFFLPLGEQFSWSHTLNSTVPALALLVFSIGAIFAGYFASRIGFRRTCYIGTILVGIGTILASQIQNLSELLLLFGFITPLGTSFVVIIATSSPVLWFVKRRGLAVGIMAAGSGFGTLIVPPAIEGLIQIDGWRMGFLALGVGFSLLLIASSYFTQTPDERNLKPYGWQGMSEEQRSQLPDFTPRQALSGRAFWSIYIMFFLGSFGATMFIVHAIPYANTIGINELDASIALGVLGAGSLFSRVFIGLLADRLNRASGVIISFTVQFVSMGLLQLTKGPNLLLLFYLCSFGIGFGYGGYLSDFIALTGDLFGRKWIQKIWALDETAFGFAGLISPIVAGAFFDRLQSYTLVFEIATAGAFIGLILALIFARDMRSKNGPRPAENIS